MDGNTTALAKRNEGQAAVDAMIQMVVDSVSSPHSQRAYRRALTDFLAWYRETGQAELNKATVQHYAAEMRAGGMSAQNINQRLSAIRKMATEASDNGALPAPLAEGIKRVKGIRAEGQRTGNWLDKDQAQAFINAPTPATLKGKRDRALLGLLIGTGIRRGEAAGVAFEQVQQRDGRWVLVDLVGKRNKTRTVPVPCWAKAALDAWTKAAGITSGRLFRPINKGDRISGQAMTAQAVYVAIKTYAEALGLTLAAHDTRRTFAKLAHKGGAPVDQIKLSLGHESIATTERYLGLEQDLTDAPCDHLGLKWDGNGK